MSRGRKKSFQKLIRVAFTLTPSNLSELKRYAEVNGCASLSEAIRKMIKEYTKNE